MTFWPQTFWPGRFGHGRFGQIKVQSRTFWPNAISTQKEILYELFHAFLHTVLVKDSSFNAICSLGETYYRNSLFQYYGIPLSGQS